MTVLIVSHSILKGIPNIGNTSFLSSNRNKVPVNLYLYRVLLINYIYIVSVWPDQPASYRLQTRSIQKSSANTEKLSQYDSYWPSFSVLAEFNFFPINWFKLNFLLSSDTHNHHTCIYNLDLVESLSRPSPSCHTARL